MGDPYREPIRANRNEPPERKVRIMLSRAFALLAVAVSPLLLNDIAVAQDDPFADAVISYDPGSDPAPGYTDPETALGSPERFTGEGVFPGVVSAFNPPYGLDEVVSLGAAGQLVVQFNAPIIDDPNNLYGIDLLIFGNTSFIDSSFPDGIVGGVFGNDGGIIEVSANGRDWQIVRSVAADGLMPTVGYIDSGPFDSAPGRTLTDFTQPVDPSLTLELCLGLTNQQLMQVYRGSGGGARIDLAQVGLAQVSYVRISNPSGAGENIEIDALSDASPRLPGDANLDGLVNVDDLLLVIGAWGATIPGGVPADFNGDDLINVDDLLIVINHWMS
jgi:hypothetical protein